MTDVDGAEHAVDAVMERLTDGKNADGKAVIRLLKPFKRHVLSITTDNGGEFVRHKRVAEALNAPVFFTAPTLHGEREPSKTPTNSSDNTLTSR